MSQKKKEPQINRNLDIFVYSHIPFKPIVNNPVYKILTCSHDKFPMTNIPIIRDYNYRGTLSDNNVMWNEYSGIHALAYDDKIHLKKYIGINHYRRFFYWLDNIPNMEVMFENFDIVLGKPVYFHEALKCGENDYDVLSQYGYYHNVRDLIVLGEVIKQLHPEMKDTVEYVFHNNNYLFNSFMSIWKTEDFLDYVEWIFPVMDAFNDTYKCYTSEDWKNYVTSHYGWYYKPFNSYYSDVTIASRVVGYLLERACNVYLHHKWENGKSLVDKAAIIPWVQVPEEYYKV